MIRLYAALGACVALIGLTAMTFHLSRSLRDAQQEIGARGERIVVLNGEVARCNAEGKKLVELTHAWARHTDEVRAAARAETAETYTQTLERARLSCRAQFDAGVRYGRTHPNSDGSPQSGGVLDPEHDFAAQWRASGTDRR